MPSSPAHRRDFVCDNLGAPRHIVPPAVAARYSRTVPDAPAGLLATSRDEPAAGPAVAEAVRCCRHLGARCSRTTPRCAAWRTDCDGELGQSTSDPWAPGLPERRSPRCLLPSPPDGELRRRCWHVSVGQLPVPRGRDGRGPDELRARGEAIPQGDRVSAPRPDSSRCRKRSDLDLPRGLQPLEARWADVPDR
jgi:hypothetical protein